MNPFHLLTPYDDVNAVLHHFAGRIKAILENQFLGMYLYGSLALGDFDPRASDIDFIVVTKDELADDLYSALQEMHAQFDASSSSWAARVEAAYIPQEALHHSAPTQAQYPQVEKGTKLFKAPLETGWVFQLYTLRERGVIISGPDPRRITSPVDLSSMRRAAVAIVEGWQEQASHDPDWLSWLRGRQAQSFVVLTLCRMLYSLNTGSVASKPAAVRWAKQALDQHWVGLIDLALTGQHDQGEVSDQEMEATLAFIRYTFGTMTVSPQFPPQIVILLGPNGVGKSTIGRMLANRRVCTFVSLEEFFLSRYATLEAYRQDRPAAYRAFENRLWAILQEKGEPVVFEEVGLSSEAQALIAGLQARFRVALVLIRAAEQTCLRRVEERGLQRNYPKSAEFVRSVWHQFAEQVIPRYHFDLEIQNEALTEDEICTRFAGWFPERQEPPG